MTNDGRQGLTFCQVGEANRPLVAVSQVADAGNIVMTDSNGGWVYNLHDERWTRVRRHYNICEMDLWLTANDANGKRPESSKPIDELVNADMQTFRNVLRQSGVARPEL